MFQLLAFELVSCPELTFLFMGTNFVLNPCGMCLDVVILSYPTKPAHCQLNLSRPKPASLILLLLMEQGFQPLQKGTRKMPLGGS